jgi:glycerol kinase
MRYAPHYAAMPFVLALDQGTTSSRAIVFDETGAKRSQAQIPLPQIFPPPGGSSRTRS